jgi:mono/diheme cytochrome c family protein
MRAALACFGAVFLVGASLGSTNQEKSQEKPKDNPPPAVDAAKPAGAEKKNPVAPTPEGLAGAKKMYGYDCAMCHGANGEGKGDLVASMNLTMKDWRDPGALSGISDAEIYEIIVKGKGKMVGEGDRLPADKVWHMVNYVRALAKKESAAKAPDAPPKQ